MSKQTTQNTAKLKRRAFMFGGGAALAGLALAIASTGAGNSNGGTDSAVGAEQQYASEPVPPGQPCATAKTHASIADLQTTAPTPIYPPADKTPEKIWTCGNISALGYGDLEVNFQSGWADVDPHTKWTGMAEQSGGYVDQVLGRPAWIRPADSEGTWPLVEVIVNGTLVTTLGAPGVTTEEVVALAKSIPTPPETLHP